MNVAQRVGGAAAPKAPGNLDGDVRRRRVPTRKAKRKGIAKIGPLGGFGVGRAGTRKPKAPKAPAPARTPQPVAPAGPPPLIVNGIDLSGLVPLVDAASQAKHGTERTNAEQALGQIKGHGQAIDSVYQAFLDQFGKQVTANQAANTALVGQMGASADASAATAAALNAGLDANANARAAALGRQTDADATVAQQGAQGVLEGRNLAQNAVNAATMQSQGASSFMDMLGSVMSAAKGQAKVQNEQDQRQGEQDLLNISNPLADERAAQLLSLYGTEAQRQDNLEIERMRDATANRGIDRAYANDQLDARTSREQLAYQQWAKGQDVATQLAIQNQKTISAENIARMSSQDKANAQAWNQYIERAKLAEQTRHNKANEANAAQGGAGTKMVTLPTGQQAPFTSSQKQKWKQQRSQFEAGRRKARQLMQDPAVKGFGDLRSKLAKLAGVPPAVAEAMIWQASHNKLNAQHRAALEGWFQGGIVPSTLVKG
jgi:hypothetical protein